MPFLIHYVLAVLALDLLFYPYNFFFSVIFIYCYCNFFQQENDIENDLCLSFLDFKRDILRSIYPSQEKFMLSFVNRISGVFLLVYVENSWTRNFKMIHFNFLCTPKFKRYTSECAHPIRSCWLDDRLNFPFCATVLL